MTGAGGWSLIDAGTKEPPPLTWGLSMCVIVNHASRLCSATVHESVQLRVLSKKKNKEEEEEQEQEEGKEDENLEEDEEEKE